MIIFLPVDINGFSVLLRYFGKIVNIKNPSFFIHILVKLRSQIRRQAYRQKHHRSTKNSVCQAFIHSGIQCKIEFGYKIRTSNSSGALCRSHRNGNCNHPDNESWLYCQHCFFALGSKTIRVQILKNVSTEILNSRVPDETVKKSNLSCWSSGKKI